MKEESNKDKLVESLVRQIDAKNEYLKELECKYSEIRLTLSQAWEALRLAREDTYKQYITNFEEKRKNKKLKMELESLRQELKPHKQEIEKNNAKHTDARDKRNDGQEKKLEREVQQLKARLKKQESEMKQLNEKLQGMNQMEVEEESNVKDKLKEMSKDLKEKTEENEYLEDLNHILLIKDRTSNSELSEARKEFIMGMSDMLNHHKSSLKIKRMGELAAKPFQDACKQRFAGDDVDVKAALLCSKRTDELKTPDWHPFRSTTLNGKHLEVIDENDEKLQALKNELGHEVYRAVTTSLLELNEYNPSGTFPIPELWNSRDGRKATLKELMQYLLKQLKTYERKR